MRALSQRKRAAAEREGPVCGTENASIPVAMVFVWDWVQLYTDL